MARTFPLGPNAARPMAAKPSSTKQRPTVKPAPISASAPPARRLRHPAHRDGHAGLVTILVIALTVAGAGLWYWMGGAPTRDPGVELQAQMEAAAQGSGPSTHVFGGALSVNRGNGRASVVAEGVPSKACVQVGWRLAKEGTIIVNGTLPTRLSAARLSELCSGDGATLMWVSEQ